MGDYDGHDPDEWRPQWYPLEFTMAVQDVEQDVEPPVAATDDDVVRRIRGGRVAPTIHGLWSVTRNDRRRRGGRVVSVALQYTSEAAFASRGPRHEWVRWLLHEEYVCAWPHVPRECLAGAWPRIPLGEYVGPWTGARTTHDRVTLPIKFALLQPGSRGVAVLVLAGLVTEPVGRQMLLDLVTFPRPMFPGDDGAHGHDADRAARAAADRMPYDVQWAARSSWRLTT